LQVGRRSAFEGIGDQFGDLALHEQRIFDSAVIGFGPICKASDKLGGDAQVAIVAANAAFNQRLSELTSNFTDILALACESERLGASDNPKAFDRASALMTFFGEVIAEVFLVLGGGHAGKGEEGEDHG
jgi:hypothetical protein